MARKRKPVRRVAKTAISPELGLFLGASQLGNHIRKGKETRSYAKDDYNREEGARQLSIAKQFSGGDNPNVYGDTSSEMKNIVNDQYVDDIQSSSGNKHQKKRATKEAIKQNEKEFYDGDKS